MAPARRCIGSTRFGIEAHDAAVEDFPRQPSQKDGLGRLCKLHWTEYTRGLRAAALERSGTDATATTTPAVVKKDAAPKTDHGRSSRGKRPNTATVAASTKVAKVPAAKQVLDEVDRKGGAAYVAAIASDEVQAALEAVGTQGHGADGVEAPAADSDPR